MRLITRFELANRSNNELSAIFRRVTELLLSTDADSPERRDALATLENIQREQASRRARPGF